MAIDLDVFEALDLNQQLDVDTNDLQTYELSNGVYSIDDTDHDLVLDNLDKTLYSDSQLEHLQADLDQNTTLTQFEIKDGMYNHDTNSDYIDETLKPEIDGHVEKIDTVNSDLEGTVHPETGVPYESNTVQLADGTFVEGVFPVFDSAFDAIIPAEHFESSPYTHAQIANEQLAAAVAQDPSYESQFNDMQLEQIQDGETPDGYTWHHHEELGKMQLVETEPHEQSAHTGGMSLWGGGYED
ncbi:HNH endonuclease [Desertibacillus haloalkaliphilus]|uniref:HNH endonuclease n=1 Tax=Desertibacillus haloalkaliphilus TaxID=1328930 RepID=UPI001C271958|nr:HNH endonuclease [Desertibacillus haloalkaliphilus]MBU8907667.1 HNH endonuclease [Desertibacillus haloalkaliphilus]